MARDIGRAGESFIEQWCALAGITANKSVVDRHGWDLHFEMSHQGDISRADGLHLADLECKVQIKTTDTDKMTEAVELSNLRAMATSTMPTFYILLKLAGGSQLVSAHLLHIDEDHCERILKRIRHETTKPKKPKLNKKTITLDFKKGVEITPLNGESLKAEIIKCIGSSQADYVGKKQHFLRSVGYGSNSHLVQVEIDLEHAERFVRMLLGDDETVEVKTVDATVTRFGVTESLPEVRSDTAIMSVANVMPDGRAQGIFRNRKTGAASEFDFDMFRGGLMGWVPMEHRKVRLRSKCFTMDISVHGDSTVMYFHMDNDALCDVTELLKNYKLIQMLYDPSDVDVCLSFNGKTMSGKLGGEGFGRGFEPSIEMLEAVLFVKNFYGYYSELLLRSSWFERYGVGVLQYKKIIDERVHLSKLSFTFDVVDPDIAGVIDEVDCLVALPIVLGDKCFVSLIAFSGYPDIVDGRNYKLTPSSMTVVYKTFFTADSLVSGSAMRDLQQAANSFESIRTVIPFLHQLMDGVIDNAKQAAKAETVGHEIAGLD